MAAGSVTLPLTRGQQASARESTWGAWRTLSAGAFGARGESRRPDIPAAYLLEASKLALAWTDTWKLTFASPTTLRAEAAQVTPPAPASPIAASVSGVLPTRTPTGPPNVCTWLTASPHSCR